jgi:hypothetical protein
MRLLRARVLALWSLALAGVAVLLLVDTLAPAGEGRANKRRHRKR